MGVMLSSKSPPNKVIEAIPDTVLMLKNMGLLNHLGVVPSITFAWVPGKILRRLFFLLGNDA